MNKLTPRISEAEWAIMKVLWTESPLSAQQVIAQLATGQPWHPKTVKTLLNRLVRKKALAYIREGRAYLYSPLVGEADCVRSESQSFLRRVFGGALQPMLAHLVSEGRLTPAEIMALQDMLTAKGRKK